MAGFLQLGRQLLAVMGDEGPVVVTLLDVNAGRQEHELGALLAQPFVKVKSRWHQLDTIGGQERLARRNSASLVGQSISQADLAARTQSKRPCTSLYPARSSSSS